MRPHLGKGGDGGKNASTVEQKQDLSHLRHIALNGGGRHVMLREIRHEIFQHDGVDFVQCTLFEKRENVTFQTVFGHQVRAVFDGVSLNLFFL